MYITTRPSSVGTLTLASDGISLTGLWIAHQKYFGSTLEGALIEAPNLPIFAETDRWLDTYFSGKRPASLPPLAPKGSPFRQAVWKHLLAIPYGQTTTYSAIAKALRAQGISAGAQAVGGAVGHNPILFLIPCHRVLGSNGTLTGFAGGMDVKQKLLWLEGHQV